mgnify:CR=1 FL=1
MQRFLPLVFALFLLLPMTSQGQEIGLMTYNIRYANPGDGPNAWSSRKEQVVEQFFFYEPAIFGIQEGLHSQVQYLDEALSDYTYEGIGRGAGKQDGEYSALYYDTLAFKRVRGNTFWLSSTPERPSVGWDAAMNRICTWALLEHRQSGRRMMVLNTHFDHVGEQARYESARLIVQRIRQLNQAGHPVVLMGDLNAEPGDRPIQQISSYMSDAREATKTPAFGPEGTYNGFHFNEPVKRRIDYIFVKRADVLKYGVLSDPENLHYPSDHFPVYAQIILK